MKKRWVLMVVAFAMGAVSAFFLSNDTLQVKFLSAVFFGALAAALAWSYKRPSGLWRSMVKRRRD